MPNRIIQESICVSDSLGDLSFFEESLFYRLIVCADDFGRFYADPNIIAGRAMTNKRGVTTSQIEKALEHLARVGIIDLYNVGGKSYLQFQNWAKYQRARATKSKFPDPPVSTEYSSSIDNTCGHPLSIDNNCCQLTSNVAVFENVFENVNENVNEREYSGQAATPPSCRFVKPSVEEITAYCRSRNSKVDPQRFYDFYEAKGWRIGSQPMKDWKAAVRTWERRDEAEQKSINASKGKPSSSSFEVNSFYEAALSKSYGGKE